MYAPSTIPPLGEFPYADLPTAHSDRIYAPRSYSASTATSLSSRGMVLYSLAGVADVGLRLRSRTMTCSPKTDPAIVRV